MKKRVRGLVSALALVAGAGVLFSAEASDGVFDSVVVEGAKLALAADDPAYLVAIFTNSTDNGTFKVTGSGTVDVLLVGGGGGVG